MVAVSKSGINFSDPKEFARLDVLASEPNYVNSALSTVNLANTAAFTGLATTGLVDTTNWSTDTYKSLLSVSEPGELYMYAGPTATNATHTVEFTVDGVVTEIAITSTAGSANRQLLCSTALSNGTIFTTTLGNAANAFGSISTDKRFFGPSGGALYVPSWMQVFNLGIPRLTWKNSFALRAKSSLGIANSTATAFSFIGYRLKGNT